MTDDRSGISGLRNLGRHWKVPNQSLFLTAVKKKNLEPVSVDLEVLRNRGTITDSCRSASKPSGVDSQAQLGQSTWTKPNLLETHRNTALELTESQPIVSFVSPGLFLRGCAMGPWGVT